MNRRELLQRGLLAAGGVAAASVAGVATLVDGKKAPMGRFPTLFLAHGAPPLLDDKAWLGELNQWAGALPRPRAVLMLSAHWENRPIALGATETLPLVYDFYNFPQRYYETKYPAPGAPELASRVEGLLRGAGLDTVREPGRGLDHGAYVPLIGMYPEADVPVLQISMPSLSGPELAALGRALEPLRDEEVLVIGSGFLTHNLRYFRKPGIPSWAQEFDGWVASVLEAQDLDSLVQFEAKAPGVDLAHPRTEHFVPVIISAAAAAGEKATFPITGWWNGEAFSRRSVQFG